MPRNLLSTVTQGDRLDSLKALRDRIAESLDTTNSARDVAALSARLAETLAAIDALEQGRPQHTTPLDQLRARREAAGRPTTVERRPARVVVE